MPEDPYADDYAVIEADLERAASLDFAAYVGFMAHYGAKLRQLAAKHSYPEGAYHRLLAYADETVKRVNHR